MEGFFYLKRTYGSNFLNFVSTCQNHELQNDTRYSNDLPLKMKVKVFGCSMFTAVVSTAKHGSDTMILIAWLIPTMYLIAKTNRFQLYDLSYGLVDRL